MLKWKQTASGYWAGYDITGLPVADVSPRRRAEPVRWKTGDAHDVAPSIKAAKAAAERAYLKQST